MPLIERKQKTEKENVSVRIEQDLANRFDKYSEWTNVPKGDIISKLLEKEIGSCPEFLATLGPAATEKPERQRRPRSIAAA